MRLHRRTQEKVGVYLIRYCRYVHRVITELHSIVHGIRRVRSASTMIFVVPAFFSLFLSLSLFPSYRGHSTNAFSSSGNTLGDTRPVFRRILSDVRSLEKNIIDGRRCFREITGIRPHFPSVLSLFYRTIPRFSVLFARTKPLPHRYKSNFLLETAHAVIFNSIQVN